ncbi:MAG: MFS transporter, partial [Verrucomicrobiae bacterium]|nr:MFS transporter [Verrucomicrobiae bacterium]
VFMISTSGRFVPGMAIITGSVEPRYRGGFMSLNSSMQQFAAGTGSYVSGLILGESGGRITHYGWVGWLSAALALIAVWRAASVQIVQDAPAETLPGAA